MAISIDYVNLMQSMSGTLLWGSEVSTAMHHFAAMSQMKALEPCIWTPEDALKMPLTLIESCLPVCCLVLHSLASGPKLTTSIPTCLLHSRRCDHTKQELDTLQHSRCCDHTKQELDTLQQQDRESQHVLGMCTAAANPFGGGFGAAGSAFGQPAASTSAFGSGRVSLVSGMLSAQVGFLKRR